MAAGFLSQQQSLAESLTVTQCQPDKSPESGPPGLVTVTQRHRGRLAVWRVL